MKFCTVYEVTDGERGPAMNVMIVLDGHRFGQSDDGLFLHIEGGKPFLSPADGETLTCTLCGNTEGLVIHHTDGNVLNNDPGSLQAICPEHIPYED